MKKYGRLLGSLILVGLLVWRIDWRQVASALAQLKASYWLLALAVYLFAQGVSAARWQMLGHMLGLSGRWGDYLGPYFLGMFFNLVLPTSVGGDVVRAWYLSGGGRRMEGGGRRQPSTLHPPPSTRWAAFLSVLADRVNGLAVLIGVACVATLCCPIPLPGWIVAVVAGMGAACLLGLAVLPLLPWLRQRLPAHPRLTPLFEGADRCLRDRRGLVGVTLLSLLVQLANVVLAWLVGEGLGLQVPPLYYGVLIPLVSILTLLPISLNGMGLREAGTVLLLAPLHVSSASAVTLSLLLFAVYAAASLMGGAVYLFSGWRVEGGGNNSPSTLHPPPSTRRRSLVMRTLSVVVPIKDECANLRPLHERLRRALDPLCGAGDGRPARLANYEMLFVDDGSKDGSFAVLQDLASVDPRVKVICLRRNFGQTPALRAGIDRSSGDVLVTMDGDLQNDPADIPMLLDKLDEGYDAVFGLRANRQDHLFIRKLPSFAGNWLIRCVTGVRIRDMGCTLRALRRDLAEALPLYGELHRFVPVLAQMHGANIAQIPVRHHPRTAGKTKYGLTRTVRVLLDLITVKFLHSYLTRPMHVLGLAGLLAMGLGGLSLLATMAMKYFLNPPVFMTGNPLLLLSVMLELVGVQLISLGLLGEVLTRTYFESQGKSAYTVRATLNLDAPDKRRVA